MEDNFIKLQEDRHRENEIDVQQRDSHVYGYIAEVMVCSINVDVIYKYVFSPMPPTIH